MARRNALTTPGYESISNDGHFNEVGWACFFAHVDVELPRGHKLRAHPASVACVTSVP